DAQEKRQPWLPFG
uniref:Peroniin-1.1a n=1 Tax=Litoria peronii TaxID=317363 RepID=PE11A_LITPE|nr:RecName: Full=Peroniin-1.1a [Litoria peronii]